MTPASKYQSLEQTEIGRLRDLLPASLRPLLEIAPAPVSLEGAPLKLRRRPPWNLNGMIEIDFRRWSAIPQPQRDLLFLREAGWFDCRNWLQPGVYQIIALVGSVSIIGELAAHNAFAAVLASGVTSLAIRQLWQNMNGEATHLNADEFALKRAQFRGYDRQAAARHLLAALELVQRVDKTDILIAMRVQRLQAIAQTPRSLD